MLNLKNTVPNNLPAIWKLSDIIYILILFLTSFVYGFIFVRFFNLTGIQAFLMLVSVNFLSMIIPVWIILKERGVKFFEYFDFKISFKVVFLSISLAIGILIVGGVFSSLLANYLGAENPQKEIKNLLSDNFLLNLLAFNIFVGILIPIGEELIMRGVLFNYLRQRTTLWASVIISALIFSLAHGYIVLVPFTLIFGFISALIYAKTNNILIPILIHVTVNSIGINFILMGT
jgi:uncharacterized protein